MLQCVAESFEKTKSLTHGRLRQTPIFSNLHTCLKRHCAGIVSCSVLQCVVVRIAVCCSVLQCVAVCCSVLQCITACCSVLQRVAVPKMWQMTENASYRYTANNFEGFPQRFFHVKLLAATRVRLFLCMQYVACVFTYAYASICIYVYVYTKMCVYTYTYIYLCICIPTYAYICIYIYTYICIYIYTYKFINIYKYIYTNMCVYKYTY